MPDWLAEAGRIWLAVAFVMYGLILATFMHHSPRKLQSHLLMFMSFGAGAVVLFNTVVVRVPGWPAMITAWWVTFIAFGTYRFGKLTYAASRMQEEDNG